MHDMVSDVKIEMKYVLWPAAVVSPQQSCFWQQPQQKVRQPLMVAMEVATTMKIEKPA